MLLDPGGDAATVTGLRIVPAVQGLPGKGFGAGRVDDAPRDPAGSGQPARAGYVPDPATVIALDLLYRASYEHRTRALDHRQAVFAWQHRSSQIIFAIVVAIVGVGLYFSWMQFTAANCRGGAPGLTEIEGSTTGFKVSSPVLGVVILLLSLAFFYLYLVHVYPIAEL